jgi:hypothetical protein
MSEPNPNRRADIEVSPDADKVALRVPGGAAALSAVEAQEAGRPHLRGRGPGQRRRPGRERLGPPADAVPALAAEKMDVGDDGEDPNRVPAPNSDEPDGDAAEVHCWIKDQTQANAMHIAAGSVAEHGWFISEVLEHQPVSRADFAADDAQEYLQYYEQALAEGEVFLYEFSEDDSEGSTDGGT